MQDSGESVAGSVRTIVATPAPWNAATPFPDRSTSQDPGGGNQHVCPAPAARTELERAAPARWLSGLLVFLSSGLAAALSLLLPPGPLAIGGAALAGAASLLIALFAARGDATDRSG